MCINHKSLLLTGALLWIAAPVYAVTAKSDGAGSDNYMFVENTVDNEYFIIGDRLSPRFNGSSVWTKYNTGQEALGYMGWASRANNEYFDLWIANSPIASPFVGIRCRQDGGNCPTVGHIAAQYTDHDGFYHTMSGGTILNGNSSYGTFSVAAFEYFRALSVGSSDTFELNFCHTPTDYNYNSGMRCKDLTSGATWKYYQQTVNKVGHLTLKSTGSLAEIMVASDGTATLRDDSQFCRLGVVGNASGVICKMISYDLQQTQVVTPKLTFATIIDTASLGFTPGITEIKYSGDGQGWTPYAVYRPYTQVFSPGGSSVYLFMSNEFFINILKSGKDLTNRDSLFTFAFQNNAYPTSGYYQFTASSQINIIPKEYGISIVSSDGNRHPKKSGDIGSNQPIEFEYKVITSAARQADSITAQVVGDSTTIGGIPYCLFKSPDGKYGVPIPAYLTYNSLSGAAVTKRNSCSEQAIDMKSAKWVQTAWNAAVDDGYFFTTTLKLLFPMNDPISQYTTAGDNWVGTVSASGEIKVSATWVGVDRNI